MDAPILQGEAVQLVADGVAPKLKQTEEGATYEPIAKKNIAKVDFNQPAKKIHDFIRGMDKVPGAWTTIDGQVRYLIYLLKTSLICAYNVYKLDHVVLIQNFNLNTIVTDEKDPVE